MRTYYVYSLRLDNSDYPFYIGKSFIGSSRVSTHFSVAKRVHKTMRDRYINRALRLNIAIIHTIELETSLEEVAFIKERELIAFYGRRDNGTGILCNHTDGGEGVSGLKHSDESKLKMSMSKRGKPIKYNPLMNAHRQQPIAMYSLDNKHVKSFPSVKDAIIQTGCSESSLHKHIVGKLSKVKIGNEHFKFKKV